jgi:hypothetical protein
MNRRREKYALDRRQQRRQTETIGAADRSYNILMRCIAGGYPNVMACSALALLRNKQKLPLLNLSRFATEGFNAESNNCVFKLAR